MRFLSPIRLFLSGCLCLSMGLYGCTEQSLALGGATVVGTAASQERGVSGVASDFGLRLALNDAIFKFSVDVYQRVSFLIESRRVVIIGRVPDAISRWQVQDLAQRAGAALIINRLEVGPDLTWSESMTDRAIKMRLQLSLTLDEDVNALNYDVESLAGVVYLIGRASNAQEARRVEFLAGLVPSVRRIETYIAVPSSPTDIVPVVRETL